MDDVQVVPKRGKGWAFATSAVLHAAIAAALFLKWPDPKPEPPKDEAVKVDLVPEQEAPKPPEEKAAEQPPPPPPSPQQEAKTEQPSNVPVPTLRPVFEFGQKDQGPAQQDGSASDGEKDTAEDELSDKKPDVPQAEEPKAVTEEASKEPPKDDLPGVPDILKALEQQEAASTAAAGKPVEEKAATPKPAEAPELKKARKLYSDAAVGGQAGMTAMGDMPREARIGQLCATELREQLRHATPRYNPLMLPAYRLRYGNVLDVPKAAFRTPGDWYDVSFRCEVDDGGLKVVSFAFKVGATVPRSEWKARKFPEN